MRGESPIFFTLPHDLSDESTYNLCESLHALLLALEGHYSVQLKRYWKKLEEERELHWRCHDSEDDVPF